MARKFTDVTPEEAKAVWDTLKHPSDRAIARIFNNQGRPLNNTTVSRWRRAGWTRQKGHGETSRELEHANYLLEEMLGILGKGPQVRLSDLVPEKSSLQNAVAPEVVQPLGWDGARVALEEKGDDELIRDTARKAYITSNLLFQEIMRQRETLVEKHPEELGKLHATIVMALDGGSKEFDKLARMRLSDAKIINGEVVNEEDDLATEIERWGLQGT